MNAKYYYNTLYDIMICLLCPYSETTPTPANNKSGSVSHATNPFSQQNEEETPVISAKGPLGDLPPLTGGPQRGSNLPPLSGKRMHVKKH